MQNRHARLVSRAPGRVTPTNRRGRLRRMSLSPRAIELLTKAGWFPGRRVAIPEAGGHMPVQAENRKHERIVHVHPDCPEVVRQTLIEFSGIRVETPTLSTKWFQFEFDAVYGLEGPSYDMEDNAIYEGFGNLWHVGEVDYCGSLLQDARGVIYNDYGGLLRVGMSTYDAINRLCTNTPFEEP